MKNRIPKGHKRASSLPNRKRATVASDLKIYNAVYEAVMEHRLLPGTKLPETAFADFFGVSRTIVRQAFMRLAHDNVLVLRPNRGAVVASPSIQEAHDVFDARRVIERAVVHSVIGSVAKRKLDGLRALVKEERDAVTRGDRRVWIRLSGEFHLRLADIAGNAVFTQLLTELVSRTSLIIALYEGTPCEAHSHADLIEAIARGNEKRAFVKMDEHLDEVESKLHLVNKHKPINLAEIFAKSLAEPTKTKRNRQS